MAKKNEKQLCWNCEGGVSLHFTQCPYCGVDVTQPSPHEQPNPFNFASPFQSSQHLQEIPQPPYAKAAAQNQDFAVTEEEWNSALKGEKEEKKEEEPATDSKRDMIAMLLLLPGVVFFLFGLALILFSHDGVLSLQWNQNVAYFYFLGATPLLYLGWRAYRPR